MTSSSQPVEVPVWDLLVRTCHWLLATAFLVAYLTEDNFLNVHTWAGYVAGGVVVLRIVWGFIGSRHARFSDFRFSPRRALAYLQDLRHGRAKRYLGHNPAGAAMIYVLLAGVLLTGGSGLMVYAYEEQAGPLASLVAGQYQDQPGHKRKYEQAEDFWEEAHELLANLTLLLVAVHILGVTFGSLAHRENLVRAMINGRKTASVQDKTLHPTNPTPSSELS